MEGFQIHTHTLVPHLLVPGLALATEGASGVVAGLICTAGVGGSRTLINV